jgi:hypothetical protein
MLTLVFKSKDGKRITTYFISIVSLFVGSYALTSIILITWQIIKKIKLRRQKNLERALPSTLSGGTDIEMTSKALKKCLKRDGAYEIIGSHLKSAIRKLLKNRNSKENIIVNRVIVLLGSIILSDMGSQIALTSPDFLAEQFKNKVKGAAIIGLGATIPAVLVFLNRALPLHFQAMILVYGGAVSAIGVMSYTESVEPMCEQHVRYLPELSKGSHYIDMTEHSNLGKIFMVTDENIKLFVKKNDNEVCTVELLGQEQNFFAKKEEVIVQKCTSNKQYVPLKKRMKSMKDIKDGDSTQNLEKILDLGLSKEDSKAISERIRN